jgi:hypothetical protein
MGMYYTNVVFRKFIKQLFEINQNISQDYDSKMQKAENLSEILETETKNLASLNGEWMDNMNSNLK